MSMFNDISCGTRDNQKECLAHANVVSLYARKFDTGQWSFIGPGCEKKWYSMKEDSPQGIWDNIAEKMLLDVRFSVQQLHCPGVNSEAKDMENCQFTLLPLRKQLRLFFAYLFLQISSVFTEQSRKCAWNMNPFTIDQGDGTINCAQ